MKALRALPLILFGALAACESGGPTDPPTDSQIAVPGAYVFDSRFEAGTSSVTYSGQVVRNLLIQDLKLSIDRLGKAGAEPITVQELRNRYEYADALDLTTLTTVGSTPLKETRYSAIATGKSIKNAPIAPAAVIGYGKTADELVNEWFEIIAASSQDPAKLGTPAVYTTADGLDLSQMIEKLLHGSVAYYRGTANYLATVVDQPNAAPESGKAYTKMEHYWDEAFGYFGAARDYGRYTDNQLAGSSTDFSYDSNSDGKIDLEAEYNFGFAKNAGKRDKGGTGTDFTAEIFEAFRKGRTAIVNQRPAQEIGSFATQAANGWEKVIAATVVHYINDSLDDMASLTSAQVAAKNNADFNKHWAEMRAFAIGLQYSPFKQITDAQLTELAARMGTAPPYFAPGTAEHQAAVADLNAAKQILKAAYGFSDANMANW